MNWQINSAKPIERIIPGSLCYLISGDRVLLIQRRNPPHIGLWSPPGGKMNPGESPQDCVRREYYEETGLLLRDPQLRAVTTVLHAGLGLHWLLFVYQASAFTGDLIASDEGDLRWIDLNDLDQHPRPAADVTMFAHVLRGDSVREMRFSYDAAEQLVDLLREGQ